jgi:pilus assembly protein Flp/PilA
LLPHVAALTRAAFHSSSPHISVLLLAKIHPVPPNFGDRIQRRFKDWRYKDRMKTIRRFWADESGATAIEYALIATGIAIAIIAAVNGVGAKLITKFNAISTALK